MFGLSTDTIKYTAIGAVFLYITVISFKYISLYSKYTDTLYKLETAKYNEYKLREAIKLQNDKVESMNADIATTNKQLDIYAKELADLYANKNVIVENNKVCGVEKQFIHNVHESLMTFDKLQRSKNEK